MRVEKTIHGTFIGARAHTKKHSALERLSCFPKGFSSTENESAKPPVDPRKIFPGKQTSRILSFLEKKKVDCWDA